MKKKRLLILILVCIIFNFTIRNDKVINIVEEDDNYEHKNFIEKYYA